MFKAIRVRNLRSLKDSGWIEIKPLTILLGSNSSGKSTFLRTFPLMTQSVNKRLRNSIAWYDDMLVDFGDFQASLNREAAINDEPIILSFNFNRLTKFAEDFSSYRYNFHLRQLVHSGLFDNSTLSISFQGKSDNKEAFISEVKFEIDQNIVSFQFNDKNKQCTIFINSESVDIPFIKYYDKGLYEFLPPIVIEEFAKRFIKYSRHMTYIDNLQKWALQAFRPFCGSRFNHLEKLDQLIYRWDRNRLTCLQNFQKFKDVKTLNNEISQWTVQSKRFNKCYNILLVFKILQIWDHLSNSIAEYFRLCDYAAPIRAEAKRYYRNQGLQTDRIDAFGRNTSEFIDSLTETQRDSYNEYLERILKVSISVRNNIGHQSMNLKVGENETNITDVGFGYSQILPIVSKLWLMQTRKRFTGLSYYKAAFATALMEQPELHLHPGMQAKLADAFIHAAINQDAPSTIIIETHSPTIINRIGRRIREGHISKNDVNVVIFDKSPNSGNSFVRSVNYNSNGQIENWPYGFFEPQDDAF